MDYQYKSVYDGLNQNEMLNSNRNLIIGKKQNNTNLFSNDTTNQSSIINSYNFDYKNQNNKINNCINVTENESNENYNYSPCKNNTINLFFSKSN